jgi:N-carbamoylputrescine amidase
MTARSITVAALQLPLAGDEATNIEAVSDLVSQAAGHGAQIILPPELFSGPYFCKTQEEHHFALARPTLEHPSVQAMAKLAKQLGVAIPTSFFERDGAHFYNTMAMIDAEGEILGTYRKSHIPDGPGYQEKYYFRPGNERIQGVGPVRHPHRRRHLLGSVVSRMRAGNGSDGRGDCCFTPPRSGLSR